MQETKSCNISLTCTCIYVMKEKENKIKEVCMIKSHTWRWIRRRTKLCTWTPPKIYGYITFISTKHHLPPMQKKNVYVLHLDKIKGQKLRKEKMTLCVGPCLLPTCIWKHSYLCERAKKKEEREKLFLGLLRCNNCEKLFIPLKQDKTLNNTKHKTKHLREKNREGRKRKAIWVQMKKDIHHE